MFTTDTECFLKHSGYVSDLAMKVAQSFVNAGVTTKYIDETINSIILESGGESAFYGKYKNYKHNSFISVNQVVHQGSPCNYRLQENDIVRICIAVEVCGMITKKIKTFVVGKENPEIAKITIALEKAVQYIADSISYKSNSKHVHRSIRRDLSSKEVFPCYDLYGHGIGLNLTAQPFIMSENKSQISKYQAIFIGPIASSSRNTLLSQKTVDGISVFSSEDNAKVVQIGETILVKKYMSEIITKW